MEIHISYPSTQAPEEINQPTNTLTQQTRVWGGTNSICQLFCHVEVNWVHCSVVHWGEVLHKIVREVFGAWSPNYLELSLTGAVSEPVKSHVDGFGVALFDGVIEDSFSAFVVSSNHCGRLIVSQFDERLSDWASILCDHEGGCHFGLCCCDHHGSNH
jgi:hypothetical protein